MKKIAACATTEFDAFTNVYITDEAMTVALFVPTPNEINTSLADVDAFLASHNAHPRLFNPYKVVNGGCLKASLTGAFVCVGKTTYFAEPPQAANRSVAYYGTGELGDHRSIGWFLRDNRLSVPTMRNTMSYLTKAGTSRTLSLEQAMLAAQIIVPFANEPLTSDYNSIQFIYSPSYGYRCNVPVAEYSLSELQNHENGWSPNPILVLTGSDTVTPGGTIELETSMQWEDGSLINHASEIYIETTGGYLPLQRVNLIGGKGKFRVTALGLSSGDSFKVKVGWRYYTGVAEKVVVVQ